MLGLVACGIVVGEVVDGDSDGDPGPGAAGSLPLFGMKAESAPNATMERNAALVSGVPGRWRLRAPPTVPARVRGAMSAKVWWDLAFPSSEWPSGSCPMTT